MGDTSARPGAVLFGTATATEGRLPFSDLHDKELAVHNPRAPLASGAGLLTVTLEMP